MNQDESNQSDLSRRKFLQRSSLVAASTAVVANFPFVLSSSAAEDKPIRIGLVGCGGRGTGAAGNAISSAPNVQIVALADLFKDRLEGCRNGLKKEHGVEVSDDRCFTGFDAYQKLVALPDLDYVILATMPHFRHIHLRAAIEAGKNVFMEKPVAVDGPGIRSVIESGEMAKKKGLSIVAGTQRRHQKDYQETIKRIQDGAIGEIIAARAYWNGNELWHHGRNADWSEMEYQCRNWYYFTWLCGDHIVEQHVHNLDVINWVMGAHPIKASGMGGRQVRTDPKYGHIFDHFAVEYEYANGARMFSQCRQHDNCESNISEAVMGTNGTSNCHSVIQMKHMQDAPQVAQAESKRGGDALVHASDQVVKPVKSEKNIWKFTTKNNNGYVQEHTDLIAAIRSGKPVNEARQIAESTLTAIMGRESAYSGQSITWDEMLNSDVKLAPESYGFDVAPPKSVVAIPGKYKMG
ncbi:MAG: Myo-inositol 2-dehydrogenase [Pedosphaera sp.]|nr:Myo-inositol 2-dehydrogenase [Pedosphaera sp.]